MPTILFGGKNHLDQHRDQPITASQVKNQASLSDYVCKVSLKMLEADEVSMVGSILCLKSTSSGMPDATFGNVNMLAVGHLYQLPATHWNIVNIICIF